MRTLVHNIDRIVILIGSLALIILGARTLHNVTLMASEVSAPDELRRDYGELTVLYALNAGNNKPVFFNRYGDALVEYSAWSSFITVDGITLDLWSHAFNVYADKQTGKIFLTMSSARGSPQRGSPEPKRYQIEQQVETKGNTARISYYIIPNQPVETVRLVLGHYGWYLQRLQLSDGVVAFERPNLSRERYESGDVTTRLTSVRLHFSPSGQSEVLRNATGPYALNVTYIARTPPPYEKTPLAAEEVVVGATRSNP